MNIQNRITKLFNIKYPIIQAGMVWVSGYKLATAVSENGGLGLIGAGSMKPDLLKEHIQKTKKNTQKPFGVNIPLLRKDAEDLIDRCLSEDVKIIFTSAGHPGKFIDKMKKKSVTVIHVVPNLKYALKAEEVGCDAVVAEGTEAGGHNGIDEITTFCLVPIVSSKLKIPVISAGGIATGSQILAALILGAEGVQIGTRFAVSEESSAHINYKNAVCKAGDSDTILTFRKIGLIRMLKNSFSNLVLEKEKNCASLEELTSLLGSKREMEGIFNGDLENGMMEAGQGSALITDILPVKKIFEILINEYNTALKKIKFLDPFIL